MIETYQQEAALEPIEPQDASFATVGAVFADGVSLIFDGETEASAKHYKVNAFVVFAANDRVRIIKDSGTYVVEYPVGTPKTSFAANTAGSATEADRLKTARTITLGDMLSGNVSFNGAANVTLNGEVVCLKNPSGSDIYFRASYANQLQYKVGSGGTWYTLQNQA